MGSHIAVQEGPTTFDLPVTSLHNPQDSYEFDIYTPKNIYLSSQDLRELLDQRP
jgi:hypothetical protein